MNSVLATIHVFADENGEEVNSVLRPAPVQVLQSRVKKLSQKQQKQLDEYHSVDTRILKQMR
jgi:hypothetical protein